MASGSDVGETIGERLISFKRTSRSKNAYFVMGSDDTDMRTESRAMRFGLRIVAAAVVVALAGFAVVRVSGWIRRARENRQWIAVNNLTPERLIARCGQPVEDKTKNLFPVIAREMSYSAGGKGTVVLAFSRTAEEGSNWVFMSMKNSSGDLEYQVPSAKIAALPCLDSKK